MKQALRHLLSDSSSAILFLVVYAVSGSLFTAAAIAVATGLVQLAGLRLMGRRIEPMQWMSLGLVVVLGGATMLTHSPRFMMIKPTIVHFAVAAVMLRPGWMIRYLPKMVVQNVPEPAIVAAGYGWAVLLMALGARQSLHRAALRHHHLGVVHLRRFGWHKARRVRPAVWCLPRDRAPEARTVSGVDCGSITTNRLCHRQAVGLGGLAAWKTRTSSRPCWAVAMSTALDRIG